ncbi:methyl-accepting chemotaxis protein [Lelliottia sp. CFBP8978]|jgi:methyl-accepting chemotaxis protein II, aspartate sensor receptor|uniref:methyl-accepting chemotaxis protein n=1 Tax=Lelliottia sp. CFBP8978 TaxID=3096522 RepID=UPI002A6AD116|nr:methyl-accepting chemotaxis protein [Lelliottia sp. CFBP8978]MDY1035808.1 methyl-accepting chemotaxis protein [Lelliottia sp. CFBP8978]
MSFSQRLRNIKMSRKLAAGFGLVLLLVAVSTVMSVLRFKEIRDVYQQTNLIYNINIEVFQAKINRLKYLYTGEEKAGQLLAGYVKHAAELTDEAKKLQWTAQEGRVIDAIGGHLASFQSSVAEMQTAMTALNADKNDTAAVQALKVAEDKVKTAGDNSSASIKEIIALVKTHNDSLANSSSTITAIVGVVAILFGVLVSWWVTRQVTRPVKHNLQLAERIASGDLSADIRAPGDDELGKLTGAMGRMNDTLRAMIGEVRSSVAQVSQAASDIAEGNTDLSSRTEQQAAAVVQTAASMEELTATVKNNADNARHASKLAAEASQTATQGGRVMRDVVSTMSDINTSSQKIADITAVINSIAFQTNILALNAAVEAARAGEQGRGFAVVASEVRSLSQRSSQAAKDIELLISESVSRIMTGSDLVAKAGQTMEQVVNSVTRVNDIMGEISSASEEQSRGIEQISRAVMELDSTTQQNASLVGASSSAAGALEDQARLLESLVAAFRLEQNARAA